MYVTKALSILIIVSWAKINDTAAGLKLPISGKILNLPIKWKIFSDVWLFDLVLNFGLT